MKCYAGIYDLSHSSEIFGNALPLPGQYVIVNIADRSNMIEIKNEEGRYCSILARHEPISLYLTKECVISTGGPFEITKYIPGKFVLYEDEE